ncbi:MAG: DUF5689 domain-containing protein [Ruminococcus flavefaciens]|nr:DUF5689 domain-containing protein [Ruminococcus flavefaciens]
MKKSILYIALLMSSAFGFTSCEGDLERPPMIEPEATITANTTIAELKAMVWQTDRNYVVEVGKTGTQNIIIAGRVISSDKAGNVFKNVVLQDNSGAITVAINAYDLYETYQQGQQIVVDMTALKIGGYNGLLQVGAEGTYNGAPSMTFMTEELFAEHAQQNGLARPERIDTLLTTITELSSAKSSVEGLQKWQSQMIRIDNVEFEDAGQPFAGSTTTDRYVKDANGNRINVRNSSYADFAKAILPSGKGSIAGILSYFGTDWQIILNDLDGCIGFGEIVDPGKPDIPDTPDTPDTPTGTTIFSSLAASDTQLAAGWTIEIIKDGGLESVWSWKIYKDAGYLNGSGYNGSATETEAYAISPVIDLTAVTGASLSFDHAAKFQTTLKTLCGVVAREEGATDWTALTIPTWPAAGAWDFVNSGNIDLKAFAGKKIQLAFKYGSSTAGADTWEIKNLNVVSE